MHHRYNDDRMVVIRWDWDSAKWKWNIHNVETEICEVDYNESDNLSVVLIKIHKWIRHQIRVHLSSICYPICGDRIYCKSKNQKFGKLQLFSVWMDVKL